jgi:histidinol-phosphate aminotransferase
VDIRKLARSSVLLLEPFKVEPLKGYVRLSLNENPTLPPAFLRNVYEEAWSLVNRYTPFEVLDAFKEEIAVYNHLRPINVFPGPGADYLLMLIADVFLGPNKVAGMLEITYPVYEEEARKRESAVLKAPMSRSFSVDIDDIAYVASQSDVLFLCNPNNPTGNLVVFTLEEMEQIMKKAKGLVVVDEAYYEFSGFSVSPLLSKYDNLIVIRTFSKGFALAGMRVGYLLASPQVVDILSRATQPFTTSVSSLMVATEAVKNARYAYENARKMKEELYRIRRSLMGMGFRVFPSVTNFLVVEAPPGVWRRLYNHGVLTRFVKTIRDEHGKPVRELIRISAGGKSDITALLNAMAKVVGKL